MSTKNAALFLLLIFPALRSYLVLPNVETSLNISVSSENLDNTFIMLKLNHNMCMIFLFCFAWQYSFQLTLKCDFEGQVVASKRRGKINNILRRPFLPLCQKKYSVRGSLARQDRRWEKGEVRGLPWNAVPPAYLFVFLIPVVWGDSISIPAPLRLPRLHLKKLHVFAS